MKRKDAVRVITHGKYLSILGEKRALIEASRSSISSFRLIATDFNLFPPIQEDIFTGNRKIILVSIIKMN